MWQPREWADTHGKLHVRNDNHWWDCETQSYAATQCLPLFRAKGRATQVIMSGGNP